MTDSAIRTPCHAGPAGRTLVDSLAVRSAGPRPASIHFPGTGQRIDLAAVSEAAERCARHLRLAGVRPGEVVGLLAAPGPEFFVGFFGLLRAGAAVSVLPSPVGFAREGPLRAQLQRIVATARMRFVVCDAGLEAFVGELGALCPGLTVLRPRTSGGGGGPVLPEVRPDDLAVVQFTSGSTGRPRGVALSHRNVVAGLRAIAESAEMRSHERLVQWIPLYHDMGLFGLLSHLLGNGEVHLFAPQAFIRRPVEFLRHVSECRGHLVTGPNFGYELMLNSLRPGAADGLDLSRWRLAFNGSEPVSAALPEEFAARLGPAGVGPSVMYPVYGMAEATLAVTFPRPGSVPRVVALDGAALAAERGVRRADAATARVKRVVSVGRPVAGMDLRLVDGDGRRCAPGELGELHIRGESVTSGYHEDPEATRAAFDGPWFRTGDLGFVLDGEVYIAGRGKEMAVVHGRNYFPEDVESIARETPGVFRKRCVAYAGGGGAEEDSGEHLGVIAETSQPAESHQELADVIHQRIIRELGALPVRVHVVGPHWLTRTTSGKWQRLRAKRRIAAQETARETTQEAAQEAAQEQEDR
ncbi:AMP-binding protein [Streptomyces pathocidini]|uniref:AMP-binding protein n=1 Tax=Streptomyces pathocidini TaxID=1650571 RepID=A0ABW7UQT8_9ACTN|nr:AMP-binding protein [Streptomyces pathocidini]